MSDEKANHCVRKDTASNGTSIGMPNFHFAGIPETLIINGVIAAILVTVFIVLKKSAWAFKKLRVKGEATRFAAIFYGPPSSGIATAEQNDGSDDAEAREEQDLIDEGSGAISWFFLGAFRLKERHFRKRCGQDAVEYLYFQRLLLITIAIAAFSSLAVLLPIDLIFGSLLREQKDYYGQTTLSNIDSSTYWVLFHIGLTILLGPAVFILIKRVLRMSLKSAIRENNPWARYRGLMISNVPTVNDNDSTVIDKNLIRRHFDEAYPKVNIVAIEFTYDTSALQAAVDEKKRLDFCRDFYAARKQQYGPDHEKAIIKPVKCKLCCGSCRGECVDGEQFYAQESSEAGERVQRKYAKMEQKPTSVIFITFENHEQTAYIKREFDWAERVFCCGMCTRRTPLQSSVSEQIGSNLWNVRYAPLPRFINWRNLSYGGWVWWLRSIAINFVIFWIVFFFSTPPLILNFLSDKVQFLMQIPIFSQWLPTFILLGVPVLLPIIILLSVQWMGYYSLATELSYQLRNLFLFLLLTLVILPGVGMTSADAVFQWLRGQVQNNTSEAALRWECVFIPSGGAFFVNFIIGLALLGNALELLRIGPLVWFEIQRVVLARTEAEREWISMQRAVFPYASQYATMLIVYTIAVVYGFICPLVMPFALLYFLLKHVIDKYNIFFATARGSFENVESKLSSGMHITATRYLFVGLFMQQLILTFFAIIRAVPIAAYVIILVSTVLTGAFLVYVFWFAEYIDPELVEAYHEELKSDELNYQPAVLEEYHALMSSQKNDSGNSEAGRGSRVGQNSSASPQHGSSSGRNGTSSARGSDMQRSPTVDENERNQGIALQMQRQQY